MRRLAATTIVLAALLAPASATAGPVDRYRGTDGVAFTLRSLPGLDEDGLARFAFTARPPEGDTGPYSADGELDVPPVGLSARREVLVGTTIACGPPAATTVFGTVHRAARRVVATTAAGDAYRLRRVRPPASWDYGGWVVGRILGGQQPVQRVDAYDRAGKRIATTGFGAPLACPAR